MDLTGHIYGRLTVLSYEGKKDLHSVWGCRCSCGKIVSVRLNSLRRGDVKSCGCLRDQQNTERLTKHNESNKTKEYNTWSSMKQRCTNKTEVAYKNYGGRGIIICEGWLNSYENFLADMGRAPSPQHSIERINNNGNYEPGNCRWATIDEQQNNRRNNVHIKYLGISKTIPQWSREVGLSVPVIIGRLKRHWSVHDALTTPVLKIRGRSREYIVKMVLQHFQENN